MLLGRVLILLCVGLVLERGDSALGVTLPQKGKKESPRGLGTKEP